MPNRNEGTLFLSDNDVDCSFNLSRSISAILRFLCDLLSTSVMAFERAILLVIFCEDIVLPSSLSLLSMFLDRMSAAKRSIDFCSPSERVGDADDDDVEN